MATDLTEQRAVALSNCDREPIHIPGVIQPFCALLVSDRSLEQVTHVSANIAAILKADDDDGIIAAELLGQPLHTILSAALLHDLSNVCGLPTVMTQLHRLGIYELWGQPLDISVHCTATRTLIELEPIAPALDTHTPLVMRVKTMLSNVSDADELLSLAVKELRHATGFDRVMVYRFLADGCGEVAAEACSPGAESFLGLRYPASDIPALARELYLKIGVRILADIEAEPVPILAFDHTETPLDISLAMFRGASPIHVEYLTNMGVRATMSIPITVNGKLWGLFALHHLHPKLVSPDLRTVVELFSQLFSLQFQQVLVEKRFCDRKRTASTLNKLLSIQAEQLSPRDWRIDITQASHDLCQLLSAHGVGYVSEQRVVGHHGDVPPVPSILALVDYYAQHALTDIVTTECLQQLNVLGEAIWDTSAGALCFSIPADAPFYLVFFRHEIIREIAWAGNPEAYELLTASATAGETADETAGRAEPKIHPRRSFEQYTEKVKGHCQPWTASDLNTALEVRTELIQLAKVKVQDFQQRQQNLLVAELNHRVKNILALIRSIARQTRTSSLSLADYTKTLESRIAALSAAHDLVTGYGLEWPNLRDLLTIELRPYLNGSRVSLSGPAVGLKANFVPTFVLVLHELTSNAAKYGALSTATGRLIVYWSELNGGIQFHWQESDGPPVTPPQQSGFGQGLIERAIPYEFDGEATLQFLPTGVQAKFWLPNDLIRWEPQTNATKANAVSDRATDISSPETTDEINVLVLEDSLLLAMEMEEMLKTMGINKINCVSNVASALKALQRAHYDLCLLDIDLKKETSFAVAYTLLEENIPYIFTTGYNSKHPVPADLKSIMLLKKPIDVSTLEATIRPMLNR